MNMKDIWLEQITFFRFDFANSNLNDENLEKMKEDDLPSVVSSKNCPTILLSYLISFIIFRKLALS